jgi:hypothetical protein
MGDGESFHCYCGPGFERRYLDSGQAYVIVGAGRFHRPKINVRVGRIDSETFRGLVVGEIHIAATDGNSANVAGGHQQTIVHLDSGQAYVIVGAGRCHRPKINVRVGRIDSETFRGLVVKMKLSFVPSASPDVLQLLTKHRSSWTPCGVFPPPFTATIVIEDLRVALGFRGFPTMGRVRWRPGSPSAENRFTDGTQIRLFVMAVTSRRQWHPYQLLQAVVRAGFMERSVG